MLKTSKNSSKKIVAVIKNEHTKAQMSQLDEEWADHQSPYLTLADVLAHEQARQRSEEDKGPVSDAS